MAILLNLIKYLNVCITAIDIYVYIHVGIRLVYSKFYNYQLKEECKFYPQ